MGDINKFFLISNGFDFYSPTSRTNGLEKSCEERNVAEDLSTSLRACFFNNPTGECPRWKGR
jgi:hypothetical protein